MAGKRQIQNLCLMALLLSGCSRQEPPPLPAGTSWASELRRCLDLTNLARPPELYERSLHFSSSATPDKTGLAHLAPEIFGDMDHGFFLHVEEHETCTDAVLAEASGAGMVSWIWSANPTGELLLYIDDPDTPVLTMPFKDFVHGKFLPARYPFAAVTAHGHNLHFPIIHSNYLKIVLRVPEKKQLATFYYQIAWNALTAPVHPFNPQQIRQQKPFLRQIAKRLTNPAVPFAAAKQIAVPPQQSVEIFRAEKAGIIESLQIEAPSKSSLAALNIQAFWKDDAQPAVDCPLHLLAGVSPDFEDVASFPVTVKNNRLAIRWPMPFDPGGRIVLTNNGTTEIPLNIRIAVSETPPPALRLHARHSFLQSLETDAPNVLTLAEISGAGRIVGCAINVRSRTAQWWGEGDQIIFFDDTNKPAWRGTGTEDYFGFAWCSTKTFDHPLRGQSRVVRRAEYRDSAMHRYHLLDTLPFHTAVKFQTEAWGLAPGTMDYEALILYYGSSGSE
jgi:hypothetical protein